MGWPVPGTLTTARLTLRPLRSADAPRIVEGAGNYDVARWLASIPYPYGRRDADTFIAVARERIGRCWAIDDGEGLCGIIGLDPDLGYWLARQVWGRGYLTEAGDAVTDAWFSDPRAGPMEASHMADNARSARVLGKLGFRDAGPMAIQSVALDQSVPGRRLVLSRADWAVRRRYRLVTRRLRLRELRDGDLAELVRIGGDPRVAPMILAARTPWPEDDARRWLQAGKYRGRPGFRAAICTRMRRLIGTVSFGIRPDGMATCGWFLDPAHWGRGYMTEAAGAFLADVMDRFDVTTVTTDHFTDNPASGALMRKLGFERTGMGEKRSPARLEPAPVVIYRLERSNLKAVP